MPFAVGAALEQVRRAVWLADRADEQPVTLGRERIAEPIARTRVRRSQLAVRSPATTGGATVDVDVAWLSAVLRLAHEYFVRADGDGSCESIARAHQPCEVRIGTSGRSAGR